MRFEKQLAQIANKAKLREWVESLPDDAKGLVIIQTESNESGDTFRFRNIGDVTLAESVFMARSYEHWIFSSPAREDDT